MKTQKSLTAARDAALDKAYYLCLCIKYGIERLEADHDTAVHMPEIRRELAELNQRVHEYNAFHNTLTTK